MSLAMEPVPMMAHRTTEREVGSETMFTVGIGTILLSVGTVNGECCVSSKYLLVSAASVGPPSSLHVA